MNCAEFEADIQRQLDARCVGDHDRLRAHRLACLACREVWEGAQLLSDAIAVWHDEIPEVDLVEAVVAAHSNRDSSARDAVANPGGGGSVWRTQGGRRPVPDAINPARAKRGRKSSALLVAAVCLVALTAISWLVPSGDLKAPVMGERGMAAMALPVPTAAPPGDVALLDQAGAAYDTLARSAVGAIEEFAWIVIPIRMSPSANDEGDPAGGRWIEGLQDDWQPLREHLDEALDFLRDVGDERASSRT
jgi:hypothetical protein